MAAPPLANLTPALPGRQRNLRPASERGTLASKRKTPADNGRPANQRGGTRFKPSFRRIRNRMTGDEPS